MCWQLQTVICSRLEVNVLCQEQYKSKASSLPEVNQIPSRTMRFAFILATVAALAVSISAESDTCPFFCKHTSDCSICEYETHCIVFLCIAT
ncbi:hypothetical protein P692DRAFT_20231052 [Suillus brevipes Sb2]|nr:hypothetical protein P692DRAFT_20231052 [Suillus brevipes Sb2]